MAGYQRILLTFDKDENMALHRAAEGNHKNTIKVLLEGIADRDNMNDYGKTALDVEGSNQGIGRYDLL